MKKFLSLLLVFVMLLGVLCSCNDTDKNTNIPSDDTNTPSDADKPSDEENKPSDEDKPSDEENKPSDEEKPNDQVTEDNTVSIGQTQYNFNFDDRIACNGVFYNNDVSYTINQDKDLVLHVNSWNESFVVPKGNMNIVGETVYDSSVVLCEDRGALIFRDYSREEDPIKVIKFVKGNPQVIIEDLSAPLNDGYSEKYCYFINENIGYLFLFTVDASCKVLSEFWKTTDSGQTWVEQSFDGEFDIDWRERIICAKMIDENIGFISAGHRADDDLARRVYITKDGGKTWEQAWKSKETISTEAYDFLYENGRYVMLVRSRETTGKYNFWHYVSEDLENWRIVYSPYTRYKPEYAGLMFCYEDLLDKKMNGGNLDGLVANDYGLSTDVFEAIYNAVDTTPYAMAYDFKDLNNDSIDELVLLDNSYNVYAIFTIKDDVYILVDTFGYLNNVGAIDKDGTIYKSGYSKGETCYYSIKTMNPGGTLSEFSFGITDYTDVLDDPPPVKYYKIESGETVEISKSDFELLEEMYAYAFSDMTTLTKNADITLNYTFDFDPI